MANSGPHELAAWLDTLGPVLPPKPREALRQVILSQGIDGHSFSMVLYQNTLPDFNVPGLNAATAQKIRKCWYRDFPEAANIKSTLPQSFQPAASPVARHAVTRMASVPVAPCPPSSLRRAVSTSPRPPGSHLAANGRPASAVTSRPTPQPASPPQALPKIGSVELLRAALDCVAERANLDRQEMYLWVHGSIPDEVWQPLWDSLTGDLVRQQGHAPAARAPATWAVAATRRAPDVAHTAMCRTPDSRESHQFDAERFAEEAAPEASPAYPYPRPDFAVSSPGPPSLRAHRLSFQGSRSQPNLHHAGNMQAGGYAAEMPPTPQFCQPEVGLGSLEIPLGGGAMSEMSFAHSGARTERTEAQSIAEDAMSSWLETAPASAGSLSPLEVANWLRMLPRDRLAEASKKAVARKVLDSQIDGVRFQEALQAGHWRDIGVADERDGKRIARLFETRRREAMMAEAAKQAGAVNREYRHKKGEKLQM